MSENINAKIHKFLGRGDDWHELDEWLIAGEYLNCNHCDVTFMEHYDNNPRYSDDGNAMLDLLAELRKRDYMVTLCDWSAGYSASIKRNGKELYEFTETDHALPMALALAVEKVIEGEI